MAAILAESTPPLPVGTQAVVAWAISVHQRIGHSIAEKRKVACICFYHFSRSSSLGSRLPDRLEGRNPTHALTTLPQPLRLSSPHEKARQIAASSPAAAPPLPPSPRASTRGRPCLSSSARVLDSLLLLCVTETTHVPASAIVFLDFTSRSVTRCSLSQIQVGLSLTNALSNESWPRVCSLRLSRLLTYIPGGRARSVASTSFLTTRTQ